MKRRLLLSLAILACACPLRAADIASAILTVTNSPLTNWFLTFYSVDTRTWMSNASSTQIRVTNNIANSTTNLYTHLITYPPAGSLGIYYTATNKIRFDTMPGSNITITIGGVWATVDYSNLTLFASRPVVVPATAITNLPVRTNIWGGVVEGLQWASNQVDVSKIAWGQFVSKTNGYATNAILQSPAFTNGINYGNAFQSPGSGISSLQAGEAAVASGDYSVALGKTAKATNHYAVSIGMEAGWQTGNNSVNIGSEASSAHTNAIAIGSAALASGFASVALGQNAAATHESSIAIGSGVSTTRTNEIRLGGFQDVAIGGLLSVAGTLTNNALRVTGGTLTNVALAASAATVTNLTAHGGNLTNVTLRASTSILTNADVHNLNATNANIHAANLRATNATIYSGLATNLAIDKPFLTNATLAGGIVSYSSGAALAFAPSAINTLANGNNVGVLFGSNQFIRLTGANTATANICGIVGAATTGGANGQWVRVLNLTGQNVVFAVGTVDATAANRILTPSGADHTVSNYCFVDLVYDPGTNYWRVVKPGL